jgi:DNA-binding CsgD family transcriptional regulator/PAS domain-containing protein
LPGPLIEVAPFGRLQDKPLSRLLDSVRGALDPDAVEIGFVFLPDGKRYMRRFLGTHETATRVVKALRPHVEDNTTLTAPFTARGLAEGSLALIRRKSRPWTGAERTRFDLLAPLLSHAIESAVHGEVDRRARQRLELALERSGAPVLILDRNGTILFANEGADTLLSRQTEEGLAVLTGGGRSVPLLSHLIRLATAAPWAVRERLALTNGRSLEACLSPLESPGEDPGEPPFRILTLHEPAALTVDDVRPHLSAKGISGRESDVVAGVLRGLKSAEIAAELFICEYTVKDHLKHVYSKLGVSSRGGLIRALYAVPEESTAARAAVT